ncbi:MAG: HAMP domain-containing protein [Candidatus Brocadia sp.]|jgi:signal transduction histidine kinase
MRIKVKILFIIIFSLILILFASTYYSQKIIEKNAVTNLKDDAVKIVKHVNLSLVTAEEIAETKEIDEILKELMLVRPNIVRIDFFSFQTEGALKPLISRTTGSIPQTILKQRDINRVKKGKIILNLEKINNVNYVRVIAPVRFRKKIYGLIEIKSSLKEFDELLAKQRKYAFIIAIISVCFIIIILVFSINQIILRPIQKLLKAMSKVKEGDLEVEVIPGTDDEIGKLTASFNSMVQTIRKNTREKESLLRQIHSFNEQLQCKIQMATEELQKRNEELSYANQSIYKMQKQLGHTRRLAAVGELAAMVAHEIGTPLHSISGHLQLLMEEVGLSKEVYRRVGIMQSQLERVISSIQHILDTTRPPDVYYDWIDLNRLLEDIVVLVLPETLSKQITIKKEFQQNLPKIFGVCSQLHEVFLNLIDNAIDASPQGGTISVTTKHIVTDMGCSALGGELGEINWIQISVKDYGKGISDDDLRHIFEPFYTTKDRGRGTGLGLAISQEIVHRHCGIITGESKINEGSVFTVRFPLKKSEQNR